MTGAAIDRLRAALADRYLIERELGAGGMATVYLAHDLKHDRKVAVKVLKPELAAVLGAERFVVEIKTTASMSHPHILPLFDSGTADGFLFYVMPFVEGETLRDKLSRETQLDIDDAVRIAREVLDALDYAHGRGVIHRDIKPENILMQGGRPMVADFGIALAVSAAAGGRMTETGLSLGTPHYMSPEQATAEKEITGRADIYSLASVLFEMLTGEPPHMGNSAQLIIMKIITEPAAAVTKYRKSVPANVASAVAKALEKLPADRFVSAKAFADALGNTTFTTVQSALESPGGKRARWKERAMIPLMAGLLLALGAAGWGWSRGGSSNFDAEIRVPMTLPDSVPLRRQAGILLALSADGKKLVYVGPGEGDIDLWERPLNSLVATRIPETSGADSPFLSPDGETVVFYRASPPRLYSVSLRGGPRLTWAADSTLAFGGDFGPDGAIYFTRRDGIRRVREPGGSVERVTQVDTARGERGHAWVDVLPKGKGAVFTVLRGGDDQHDIAAVDFASGQVTVLVRGTYARYVAPGRLLYVDATGGLFAVNFDEATRTTRGAPIPVATGIGRGESGVANITFSETGAMLYALGDGASADAQLFWVDRRGVASPIDTSITGRFDEVSVAPDGRRIAFGFFEGGTSHIWTKEMPNGPVQKLTLTGDNYSPSWSADGQRVYFISQQGLRPAALFERRADGSINGRPVFDPTARVNQAIVSRDGAWIVFVGEADIFARRTSGDTATIPLLTTSNAEISPQLSPDGRWLAYITNETGSPEVYVSPFPDVATSRTIVSQGGGTEPQWSSTGRELFYNGAPGVSLIAAQVELSPTFRVVERRVLFNRQQYGRNIAGGSYAVAPDGQRFLMYRSNQSNTERFILALNWMQTLGRGGAP